MQYFGFDPPAHSQCRSYVPEKINGPVFGLESGGEVLKNYIPDLIPSEIPELSIFDAIFCRNFMPQDIEFMI
jgi:hypothetical protein